MALHELMHTDWGLSAVDSPLEGGTMGRAYHWDGCEQLAREAPEKAVENADSLAMWAMLSSIMMQRWPVNEKTLNMGYV